MPQPVTCASQTQSPMRTVKAVALPTSLSAEIVPPSISTDWLDTCRERLTAGDAKLDPSLDCERLVTR